MADTSVAAAKRRRKQSWRAFHRTLRSVNSKSQAIYRKSQRTLDQPSMISLSQGAIMAGEIAAFEKTFAEMQKTLGVLVQIIREGI